MSTRKTPRPVAEQPPASPTLSPEQHPDHVAGRYEDNDPNDPASLTPLPDGPLPQPFPGPLPQPLPLPGPLPIPQPFPQPIPTLPIRFCAAVSGRYSLRPAGNGPLPILPLLRITVRVDVDRFQPQQRISIEVNRLLPRASAHAIAEVRSDRCIGLNQRRIQATITYREGDASLLQGSDVLFEATRGAGFSYGSYALTLSGGGATTRRYALQFDSPAFDAVEFEVDRVANAGEVVTGFDTASHANRPADLPAETLTLATVYQRAGFDVTMSPGASTIPLGDAGSNGTWSDGEMHNAMVTYWSRFADRPQWALWVLYAARHDQGRSLGGVMFDDIGAQHRQGTAIFTDSFIQDAPAGDAQAAAWRRRMVFWTAVHEMGHAFNLAHAWQKALGTPQGAPGDPWIPLANAPESRSFMNYPFRVSGGQAAFFSDFRFRFSDDELVFMRHAPRRFVQMGNSNWFVNHGFEAPEAVQASASRWSLAIRPNRQVNHYAFLEPVVLELKLTRTADTSAQIDDHLLEDGRHVTVYLQRQDGPTRVWRPMLTHCHRTHDKALRTGESLYGAHAISQSTSGWLIDEPGFYKVQAAVDTGDGVVVSNVLRLHVATSRSEAEDRLAPDYFTEDVARALAFRGAPALVGAMDTLRDVVDTCPDHPAAVHAALALSTPGLRDYKRLDTAPGTADGLVVHTSPANLDAAAQAQQTTLMRQPGLAADTLGHIPYFDALDTLAGSLEAAGAPEQAGKVLDDSIQTMKTRGVLASVVQATERHRARLA